MTKFLTKRCILLLPIMLFSIACTAFAESSHTLVSAGNLAYKSGEYDKAMDFYEKASVDEPESPQIYFNMGNVHYMKGDYQKAVEFFEKAAVKTKDLSLEARSYYNVGNALFRESERQKDSNLQEVITSLEKVVANYQKALKLKPDMKEASHNIEIARLFMKQIMDEIKKQKEKEKEKQKKAQEAVEKIKELIKREEQIEQGSKALEETLGKEGKTGEIKDRFVDLSEEQKEIEKDTMEFANNIDTRQDPSQEDLKKRVKGYLEDAVAEQKDVEDNLNREDPRNAARSAENAKEALQKVLEEMTKGDKDQQKEQQQQDKDKKEADGNKQQQQDKDKKEADGNKQQQQDKDKNKKEEDRQKGSESSEKKGEENKKESKAAIADEDAHNILNEERKNRKMRSVRSSQGSNLVEKDW